MKKTALVYDDDAESADRISERLRRVKSIHEGFDEVRTLSEDELCEAFWSLNERATRLRGGEQVRLKGTPIDDAAVFIVDYDLVASRPGDFLTGETVAYVARCFSDCGIIVGLNQYGHNTFDLTLKGHPESFADLDLGEDQIANPNLWGGSQRGFHPWHWMDLAVLLADFKEKLKDVKQGLADGTPICEVMGISAEVFATLPKSIGQFLGKEPEKTTFREFARESGNGLRPKDAQTASEHVIARVAAARISKWLKHLALPGQNILVDAPHLVARYPSLLDVASPTIEDWNATAEPSHRSTCKMISGSVSKYRLKKSHWVSRPVWRWSDLSEDDRVPEVREPWHAKPAPFVFCEDASRFYREQECTVFLAEADSPFTRRYVKHFENVDYRPSVRFSL